MMKLLLPCVLCAATVLVQAADSLQSKTTYSKAYGETKNAVAVDPAKDLPRYPAVEPKDAIGSWQVKKGFKLELAAHEPQLRSPVAISYDERGRMFVCEMIDYSEMRDVTPHLGRVSMLEDKDGDGYYETSTVFADNLPWPTGLICANGGVYVIATPDVWFFKDTKGTGKADVREVVYTGFGTGLKLLNVQGLANCPQWGLDNRIHIQSGPGNKGLIKCLKRPDLKEIELGAHDFWFDPKTLEFGLEAGGGQYGMSYDNYGRRFVCSNSDHLQYYLYDDKYMSRNPYFSMPAPRQSIAADGGAAEVYRISPDEPWRIIRTRWRIAGVVKGVVEGGGRVSGYFTGATGTTIYRGDAYGDDFINNSFTGDAGGQLVHRKKITADGVSLVGHRPADELKMEFAASKDTWVRVVNFANAPDGCLNVIDMYREVIEHPWSIPDEIKRYIDLNSGNDRGRVYRIVPENFTNRRGTKVNLADASTEELVKTLAHPNGWHRDTAARLLYERQDKAAVPLLEKLMETGGSLAKIHALAVLEGLNSLSEPVVIQCIKDADPRVAERGLIACERFFNEGVPDAGLASVLTFPGLPAFDADKRLRFQLALTLSLWTHADPFAREPRQTLHILGKQEGGDPMFAAALLLSNPSYYLMRPGLADSEHPGHVTPLQLQALRLEAAQAKPREASNLLALVLSYLETEQRLSPEPESPFSKRPALGEASADIVRVLSEGLKRQGMTLAKFDTEHQLDPIFASAAAIAADSKQAEGMRIKAVELLGFASSKEAAAAFDACLASGQPDAVQVAAVATLSGHASAEVTKTLVGHWSNYGAKAREVALTALTARDDRALAVLEEVQSGSIKPQDFTALQVQGILHSKDAKVAALAKQALASVIPPSREEVVAKFKDAATTKGDAKRGQVQYMARCVACHRAANMGIQVGPDLITVKTKGRDGILTAILEPSKEVAAQYIAYNVTTKDGQTLNGIIVHDDASSLTLRLMGGVEQTIQRSNIKGTSSTGASLMPDGLETGMSVQDMADVLSFVEELK